MKCRFAVLLPAVVLAVAITPNHTLAQSGYAVTGRGADFNILQKSTSAGGTNRVHRFIQLATGINYQNAYGQWTPSQPVISILPQGGGAATQGLHQVFFPGDIGNGVLKIVTPDGRVLQSRPLGVTYDDGKSTVFIGLLTNSAGWLTASNQVTYKDCFTGIHADLVCTYRLSGFECDLVFRAQPPAPNAYGLSDDESTVQLVTEFFNTQDPQQIRSAFDDWFGLLDQTLKFGKMTMAQGKAFASQLPGSPKPTANSPTPVYKSWLHLGGRTFLIEEVPLVYLTDELDALPLSASIAPTSRNTMMADSRLPLSKRLLPPARQSTSDTSQIQIASADLNKQPGVVLDYNVVDYTTGDFTFYSANTYYVSGGFNFSGNLTIQGDCVLKFPEDGSGGISLGANTIVCPSDPTLPSMLTSVNDDSVGEPISGVSTGSPAVGSGVYLSFVNNGFDPFNNPDDPAASLTLNNLNFAYAGTALIVQDFYVNVGNCQFLNSSVAIDAIGTEYYCGFGDFANNPPLQLNNVLIAGCDTAIQNDYDTSFSPETIVPLAFSQLTADSTIILGGYGVSGVSVSFAGSIVLDPYSYWDFGYLNNSGTLSLDSTVVFPPTDTLVYDPDMSSYRTMLFRTVGNAHYYPAVNSPYSSLGYQYPAITDTDYDGLADSWEMYWFGTLAYNGATLDSGGLNTLLDDYNANPQANPNVIQFQSIQVTNQFVNSKSPPAQLNVTGYPYYIAISVDDTNYLADASWQTYAGTNIIVPLGTTQGWHDVWIGLRGYRDDTSAAVWQWKRLKLDTTPPALVITGPTNGTVNVPMIQLTGYSPEALSSLCYDLTNALGLVTNQQALVTDQLYTTNSWEFTTNLFQAFDVPLTNGVNTIILHAMDMAGNISTLATNFTLDYSGKPAPVAALDWPPCGALVGGDDYTLVGHVDDYTATVTATVTDADGISYNLNGVVERDGRFWVDNVPILQGTNVVTLGITNRAGYGVAASITNYQSTLGFTFDCSAGGGDDLWNSTGYVAGTVDSDDCAVWVNGVEMPVDGGYWGSYLELVPIPISPGGVATYNVTVYPAGHDPSGPGNPGSGSGAGYQNPFDPDAVVYEFNLDKPARVYVASDEQNMSSSSHTRGWIWPMDSTDPANASSWMDTAQVNRFDQHWNDGGSDGGSSYYDSVSSLSSGDRSENLNTEQMTWNPDMWGWLTDGSGTFGGDNPFGPQSILPAVVVPEHCEINDPVPLKFTYKGKVIHDYGSQDWEGSEHEETYTRNAQTKMKLATGGRAVPGAQSLIKISGSAWEVLDKRVAPPDFNWDRMRTIPPETLTVGTLGNLDANGELWLLLPDGSDQDVTIVPDPPDYYIYGENGSKYKLVHETVHQALTDKKWGRTNLGIGEEVKLGFYPALPAGVNVTWTTCEGAFSLSTFAPWTDSVGEPIGNSKLFTAPTPSAQRTTSVMATAKGQKLEVPFQVYPPSGVDHAVITATHGIQDAPIYTQGVAGAEMQLTVYMAPTFVSFYNVQMQEMGEDATDVHGYFSNSYFTSRMLHHYPGGDDEDVNIFGLTENNSWVDSCWTPDLPQPPQWSTGRFTWDIPWWWTCGVATHYGANNWQQVFTIDANGTATITKFNNQTVSRPVNSVPSPNKP